MPGARPVRMAILCQQPLFRDLLRRAFCLCTGIEVWADAASGSDLIQAAEKAARREGAIPFDVLLVTAAHPVHSPLETASRLRQMSPNLGIVVLGSQNAAAPLPELGPLCTHGFAYLSSARLTDFDALHRAVLAVAEGRVVIDQSFMSRKRLEHLFARLTERQTEILHFTAQGYSNTTLAETLHLSPRTVENHLLQIYRQLDIPADRTVMPRVRAVTMYLALRSDLLPELAATASAPESIDSARRPA